MSFLKPKNMSESLGKKAEHKIKEWLDRPDDGYSFDRIVDQTNGFIGSSNICDFDCYKFPYMYYIESKETEADRFDFSMLTDTQRDGLYAKSKISGVFGLVIVLFTTYKRAFIFNIKDMVESGLKSLNINKINKWSIPYAEIKTVPSRKMMLDYTGELDEYMLMLTESFGKIFD